MVEKKSLRVTKKIDEIFLCVGKKSSESHFFSVWHRKNCTHFRVRILKSGLEKSCCWWCANVEKFSMQKCDYFHFLIFFSLDESRVDEKSGISDAVQGNNNNSNSL